MKKKKIIISLLLFILNFSTAFCIQQDSLIRNTFASYFAASDHRAIKSFAGKLLSDTAITKQLQQTLIIDIMNYYIEASINLHTNDFDSRFTIPTEIEPSTHTISYLTLLSLHSAISLLNGDIDEFEWRCEKFMIKGFELTNWNKTNAREHRHWPLFKIYDNTIGIIEGNNYVNEANIYIRMILKLIKQEIGEDNYGYAFTLNCYSRKLQDMGLYQESFKQNSKALEITLNPENQKYAKDISYTSYNNISGDYFEMQQFKESEAMTDSAYRVIRNIPNYTEHLRTYLSFLGRNNLLGNYAKVKWARNKWDSTVVVIDSLILNNTDQTFINEVQAGVISMRPSKYSIYGTYLLNINNLDSSKIYLDSALKYYLNSKWYVDIIKAKRVLMKLGWVQYLKGKQDETQKYFDKALAANQELLSTFFVKLSDYQKEMFFPKLHSDYDQYNFFLINRFKNNDSNIVKMINNRLNIKGLIMSSSKNLYSNTKSLSDSTLLQLNIKLNEVNEEIAKIYLQSLKATAISRASLDSLEISKADIEKKVAILNTKHINSEIKFDRHWESIKNTLKNDEAAIEIIKIPRFGLFKNRFNPTVNSFLASDSGYYCAIIIKSKSKVPEYVILDNSIDVEKVYEKNYNNAIYPSKEYLGKFDLNQINIDMKNNLKTSYNAMWKEIDSKLKGIKRVFISNDGVFQKINPNVLIDEKGIYNIDKYDIEILSSLNVLLNPTEEQEKLPAVACLFGYPNFNLQGSNELVNDFSTIENTATSNQRSKNQLETEWKNLKYTKEEIQEVNKILKNKMKVLEYTNNMASESNLKNIKSPEILHIATHGYFLKNPVKSDDIYYYEVVNNNSMMNSGLILAGANHNYKNGTTGQDGILTASEAAKINLSKTKLVVLSACETGLGEIRNGEGVYGLQRAFLIAGTKYLMMSLWKVDDYATKELMIPFYKFYLECGNPAVALLKAQRKLKKDSQFGHPMFWGGFVVIR